MNTRRVIFWFITLIFIAAPVLCTEIYLRHKGFGDPILYYVNDSYRYAPLPDQCKKRRRKAMVTVDSYGLRGVKDWGEKTDLKILFIGDSVTWGGTDIDDIQSFPHLVGIHLEKRLNKSVTSGNAGVNGYGTDNMAERLLYKRFNDEDIIVVVLIAGDAIRGLTDLRSNFFCSSSPPPPFKAIWEVSNFVVFRLSYWMRHHNLKYFDVDQLKVAQQSLERLFSVLREKQKEAKNVLLVLSPYEKQLNNRESVLTQQVREILLSSDLPVLDLHQVVTDSYTSDIYYDDIHLDISGHKLYAEAIANELSYMLKTKGGNGSTSY